MPQKAKGARLHQRKTGIFYIRDTGRNDISTGTRSRRDAERALANYIAMRDRPSGPATPDQMTVSEALAIYGTEHAPHVADPVRIAYAIEALDAFWGGLSVSAVTDATCLRYGKTRVKPGRRDPKTKEVLEWLPVSPGTIRRELGVLRAALTHCHKGGHLLSFPSVNLPAKPPSKDRWLTRDEAARLLRAAWRNPHSKHLARFILVGINTGTRKTAILGLQYHPNTTGGWVDLERGIMYRRGSAQRETKKLQTTARLPRQLLAHLRRWAGTGDRYVVSEGGARIGDIKTAWRRACREAGLADVTPHTLRHTAITWAMQNGAKQWDVEGYFGVSMQTIKETYGHHHPDYQATAVEAMERRR
ncbi:site-specific integrase [Roseovarius autotrophicus]|uniref:site-specific integrase n=1 Tax=Roseovarius autotrophicus TaxID=2824121 RepID=UPI001B36F985|nr:site-specific integrase [Roseovarius autotrophicus]